MGWFFPRHRFDTSYIVDLDDFNDNLALAAHESAFLNESNWAVDALQAIQDAGDAAHDIAVTIHKHVVRSDPHAGAVSVPQSLSWVEVSNTEKSFESRGGVIEVDISFQINNEPTNTSSKQTGLMFCISLDGTPQMASLIGSGDLGNDQKERPTSRYDGSTGAFGSVAATYYGTGPAIKAQQIGLVCQLSTPVEPGRHTVALMARNLALDNVGIRQYVSQRVVTVKDFWARGR